jgi:hypothetical protein
MCVLVNADSIEALQGRFLCLLPSIEMHGQIYFRDVKCPARKADAIQEMRALAWKWFVRLARRGKNPGDFIVTFVRLVARAVNSGRRLAGMESAKDVMNPRTQKRQGFAVTRVPDVVAQSDSPWTDALKGNFATPPPDAAAFRIDFPQWLTTLSERDRRVVNRFILGERTNEMARRFGLSKARVSQLRREFSQRWARFHGEAAVA